MAYQSIFKGSIVDSRLGAIKNGGSQGQVLTKSSNNDYETSWQDPPGGNGTIVLIPVASSAVGVNTIFVDSADNLLKFKNSAGGVYEIGLGVV